MPVRKRASLLFSRPNAVGICVFVIVPLTRARQKNWDTPLPERKPGPGAARSELGVGRFGLGLERFGLAGPG